MGLITKVDDPYDMRRRVVKLTPKGEEMIKTIKEILYGQQDQLVG
jgi:DNA-binding MarR family transcriptional regulator